MQVCSARPPPALCFFKCNWTQDPRQTSVYYINHICHPKQFSSFENKKDCSIFFLQGVLTRCYQFSIINGEWRCMWVWCCRLKHLNVKCIHALHNSVSCMNFHQISYSKLLPISEGCIDGHQLRGAFSNDGERWANKLLEIAHADMFWLHERYYFIDDSMSNRDDLDMRSIERNEDPMLFEWPNLPKKIHLILRSMRSKWKMK